MGESRTRCGRGPGRFAVRGLLCACLAASGLAHAQAKQAPGEKSPARALAGSIVHYEEVSGTAILYHEAQGGLVLRNDAPAERPDGSSIAEPTPAKAASAKAPAGRTHPRNGATPLRAPQRRASPAEGVAMRR